MRAKIIARLVFGRDRRVFMAHAILVIRQPEEVRHPTDIELGQHKFEPRIAIKHAVVDDLGQ